MPLKAIMYHYVRLPRADLPHFKFLHAEDFAKQLDYFAQNFGFVHPKDLLAATQGKPLPEGVLLTFDDGFIDHYTFVLPELEKRAIAGFFFIPTQPVENGGMLPVHRVHHLLGRFDAGDVADRLRALVDDTMLDSKRADEFRQATYRHQNNSEETVFVKRMLNYFLAYEYRKPVLDALMAHYFGDEEQEIAEQLYMKPEHMRALAEAGMVVGSHSVTHPVMSRLSEEEQRSEIRHSFAFLEKLLGLLRPRTFCYPYGGPTTFTPRTEQLLAEEGVAFSFAVQPRDITADDLRQRPQALPRYDCNMFPHGQCRN